MNLSSGLRVLNSDTNPGSIQTYRSCSSANIFASLRTTDPSLVLEIGHFGSGCFLRVPDGAAEGQLPACCAIGHNGSLLLEALEVDVDSGTVTVV
jgi:hypothetical protein